MPFRSSLLSLYCPVLCLIHERSPCNATPSSYQANRDSASTVTPAYDVVPHPASRLVVWLPTLAPPPFSRTLAGDMITSQARELAAHTENQSIDTFPEKTACLAGSPNCRASHFLPSLRQKRTGRNDYSSPVVLQTPFGPFVLQYIRSQGGDGKRVRMSGGHRKRRKDRQTTSRTPPSTH